MLSGIDRNFGARAENSFLDGGRTTVLQLVSFKAPVALVLLAANPRGVTLELVIPLALSCLAIMIILPISAARGRLHIPGWVGFALFSFVFSYTCARVSGVHGIVAHPTGVFFSIAC